MGFFSQLRRFLLGAQSADPSAPDRASVAETVFDDAERVDQALPGVIADYNPQLQIGLIELSDDAQLGFGREALVDIEPVIGARIVVLATALPPPETTQDQPALPGLFATRVALYPGSENEYAARLRIHRVEKALRGAGERPPLSSPATGEPPWARGKNRAGRLPAGPARPPDAFFAVTVVLQDSLPDAAAVLSSLLHSPGAHVPAVRIIPLVRNAQPEPGFSAEVTVAGQRAFLLYRPVPYHAFGGTAHVGLFTGGPRSPRDAIRLGDQSPTSAQLAADLRLLSDLCRALLLHAPSAIGLVLNRARRVLKPREVALRELGDVAGQALPFAAWLDAIAAQRDGTPCLTSVGMESFGLPDVCVLLSEQTDQADQTDPPARPALLAACQRLIVQRSLGERDAVIELPTRIHLQPGSVLSGDDSAPQRPHRITHLDDETIVLSPL